MSGLDSLLNDIKKCSICKSYLPHGIRPVLQTHAKAKILIAGQAPGKKVHESGIPFDDASGNRLREWLGITPEVFYDPTKLAILPMGFCYPGTARSGDLAPRPECEAAWRKQLLAHLKNIEVTLVLGNYAHDYHFGKGKTSLTERVQSWRDYWPTMVPLPHPSPRNNIWLKKNAWFEKELIPKLRARIQKIIEA